MGILISLGQSRTELFQAVNARNEPSCKARLISGKREALRRLNAKEAALATMGSERLSTRRGDDAIPEVSLACRTDSQGNPRTSMAIHVADELLRQATYQRRAWLMVYAEVNLDDTYNNAGSRRNLAG